MIDSTIVKAHQHATRVKKKTLEALGHPRGGLTTKIHCVVDAHGTADRF